jgi:hypothetical protein
LNVECQVEAEMIGLDCTAFGDRCPRVQVKRRVEGVPNLIQPDAPRIL